VTLPAGASLERTSDVLGQVEAILAKTEGIESYQTIGGYGVVTASDGDEVWSQVHTLMQQHRAWDRFATV